MPIPSGQPGRDNEAVAEEPTIAAIIVPREIGGYGGLIHGQSNSPCIPCVEPTLTDAIAFGEEAAERLGWERPYVWREGGPDRWELRATYTGFKVRFVGDITLPLLVRGYEIRVTATGLESRLVAEDSDDATAVRHETEKRLRTLLAETSLGPEGASELDAFACVLQVSVRADTAGVICSSLRATVQMSRRVRELAEAALGEISDASVPISGAYPPDEARSDAPLVLAAGVHKYAPPPWRMFDALVDEIAEWLTVQPGEVAPNVTEAMRPERVLWSSLWPASPGDTFEFTVEPDGEGSQVRFVWRSPSPPEGEGIGLVRHRLNKSFGDHLRSFVDTGRA